MSHVDRTVLGAATTAGKWWMDINTGASYAVPTWTGVNGMSNFVQKHDPTLKDDSDYGSGGYGSQAKTGLDWGASVTVGRKVRADAPTVYDVGQEALRTAAATLGTAGVVDVRWYEVTPSGPIAEAYRGYAEVGWGPGGGAHNDLESVAIVLTGRGARETITHPDYTAVVPTLGSISPAVGIQAGGTLHKLIGTGFMLAGVDNIVASTGIKFGGAGGTAASSWITESDNVVYVIAPALTAGTKAVVVYNAVGVSTVTVNVVIT